MPSALWYFPYVVCSKINGSSSLDSDSRLVSFFLYHRCPSFLYLLSLIPGHHTMHIFTPLNVHRQTCCEVQGWFPLSPHFPAHSVPCGLVFAHCLLLHQLLLFQHYCLYKGPREVRVYVATSQLLSFFAPQWLLFFCTQLQAITALYIYIYICIFIYIYISIYLYILMVN